MPRGVRRDDEPWRASVASKSGISYTPVVSAGAVDAIRIDEVLSLRPLRVFLAIFAVKSFCVRGYRTQKLLTAKVAKKTRKGRKGERRSAAPRYRFRGRLINRSSRLFSSLLNS